MPGADREETGGVWVQRGFDDFAGGSFDNGGSNLSVNAHGIVEMIHRTDVNNDGYVDIVLPNGHWVAYSRHEHLAGGPNPGATAVAFSTDFGRTWKRTGASLRNVSQQTGVVLPDGGIALTYRSHSWQGPGVAITYDEGRSFDYLLTGPYETESAFVTGTDEFVVFTSKSHRSDSNAGIYRWVPEQP